MGTKADNAGHRTEFPREHRLLTKEEAAELLHTTPRHIERLAEENRLAHYRVGRFFRFELDEIEQYLERTHVAAKEDV